MLAVRAYSVVFGDDILGGSTTKLNDKSEEDRVYEI